MPESFDGALLDEHKWLTGYVDRSVTELEIAHGALDMPEQTAHTVFYFPPTPTTTAATQTRWSRLPVEKPKSGSRHGSQPRLPGSKLR